MDLSTHTRCCTIVGFPASNSTAATVSPKWSPCRARTSNSVPPSRARRRSSSSIHRVRSCWQSLPERSSGATFAALPPRSPVGELWKPRRVEEDRQFPPNSRVRGGTRHSQSPARPRSRLHRHERRLEHLPFRLSRAQSHGANGARRVRPQLGGVYRSVDPLDLRSEERRVG